MRLTKKIRAKHQQLKFKKDECDTADGVQGPVTES
jgi:hypothetical protein